MNLEIRVICSLCGGGDWKSCPRCYDGTEEIKKWHASRGLRIPKVKLLSTGYVNIHFGGRGFAQFPKDTVGKIPDAYIFEPEWNRESFADFEIVGIKEVPG